MFTGVTVITGITKLYMSFVSHVEQTRIFFKIPSFTRIKEDSFRKIGSSASTVNQWGFKIYRKLYTSTFCPIPVELYRSQFLLFTNSQPSSKSSKISSEFSITSHAFLGTDALLPLLTSHIYSTDLEYTITRAYIGIDNYINNFKIRSLSISPLKTCIFLHLCFFYVFIFFLSS